MLIPRITLSLLSMMLCARLVGLCVDPALTIGAVGVVLCDALITAEVGIVLCDVPELPLQLSPEQQYFLREKVDNETGGQAGIFSLVILHSLVGAPHLLK